MEKLLFDLQLFAEEAGAEQPEAGTEPENTIDENKPGTEQPKESGRAEPKADEKKYSDADLDRIIGKKFAELEQKKQKEIAEAEKLAKMNAEEKANYKAQQETERADKIQKELDEYKRKDALNEMSKTARSMLAEVNISIPDELLSRLVTTDAEETKAAVDGFSKLFNESVEKAVKEKLRGETPKAGTGGNAPVSEIDKRIKKYEI